ncbi:TIGR03668 family PPOX class F420-dependent oxidoreductase [Terrabacter aeriphilus]|uniref:TIGR03668 family PPOX class F420-dependent oxidoreductase n=1 Tax=Terrabacter aeriphilus TaxID=515662 RepID=A0ABP9J2N3_9MICO
MATLDAADALARLTGADHGVLATVHPTRGPDLVPCVFAVDRDGLVGIPVDRVKAKRSTRLQRERNLELDPRATLLVEHWESDDWSRLWWVRASLRHVGEPSAERLGALADLLAGRHVQYRDQPFDHLVVLRLVEVTGWSAH